MRAWNLCLTLAAVLIVGDTAAPADEPIDRAAPPPSSAAPHDRAASPNPSAVALNIIATEAPAAAQVGTSIPRPSIKLSAVVLELDPSKLDAADPQQARALGWINKVQQAAGPVGALAEIPDDEFAACLEELLRCGAVSVLSRPVLVTQSGRQASIEIGDAVRFACRDPRTDAMQVVTMQMGFKGTFLPMAMSDDTVTTTVSMGNRQALSGEDSMVRIGDEDLPHAPRLHIARLQADVRTRPQSTAIICPEAQWFDRDAPDTPPKRVVMALSAEIVR